MNAGNATDPGELKDVTEEVKRSLRRREPAPSQAPVPPPPTLPTLGQPWAGAVLLIAFGILGVCLAAAFWPGPLERLAIALGHRADTRAAMAILLAASLGALVGGGALGVRSILRQQRNQPPQA